MALHHSNSMAHSLAILATGIVLWGCPGGNDAPEGDDGSSTTAGSTGDASATSTTAVVDEGGETCPGCVVGFSVQIVDTEGANLVGMAEIRYTKDGVPTEHEAADLCDESSCYIDETAGDLEITVEYGTCSQTKPTQGWQSCGCSLGQAPWDPLLFTFDPTCAEGMTTMGESTTGEDTTGGDTTTDTGGIKLDLGG